MVDGTGTSSYVYDSFGEPTSDQNGAGKTVSYGYDADGNTTQVTYPLPSNFTTKSVEYQYDGAALLNQITDLAGNHIAVASTADGLPNSVTLPTTTADTISTVYDNDDDPSTDAVERNRVRSRLCVRAKIAGRSLIDPRRDSLRHHGPIRRFAEGAPIC